MSSSLRNYEIKQKLGSGSYGIIYKAYNKRDKSTCVLKQISLSRMAEKARKNAANQAHIMGKLKHPFIVCYYDSFVEDNNLNIIMEFCDGGDLCYYLKQQNKKFLKEQKIWKFFIQICMGLEYIHKNKILHRDIKTLNIFLNKDESVKIGDLGVAKMLNAADFAHTMVGTPFYLSPELCEQKPYNEKSDIWALGCLLYQLCTFKHPFEAANQASLILKIIRGKYDPIPQFYSKQLREMINMCLERDYKRRPTANMILTKPSIKKMIEDLQFNKIIDQFYIKAQNPISAPIVKPAQKQTDAKPTMQKVQVKPTILPQKLKRQEDVSNNKSIVRVEQTKLQPKVQQQKEAIKKVENRDQNIFSKRRQSQPVLKTNQKQKDDKPKLLFGSEQSKLDFQNALENKLKRSPKKSSEFDKPEVRKNPISFDIPWKGSEKKNIQNIGEQKMLVHNKNLLFEAVAVEKKDTQVVYKVKIQKKVEPKVYEVVKQNQKPVAIIKSAGFSKERPETAGQKKSEQINQLSKQKKIDVIKNIQQKGNEIKRLPQKQVTNSMKNIRKQSEQRPSYLPKKQTDQQGHVPHYPPKFKKPSVVLNEPNKNRPPKHLPHGSKCVSSSSKFTQVTKQEQDLIANLPDIVKVRKQQMQLQKNKQDKEKDKVLFNQIDDQLVAQMYQQMMMKSVQPKQTLQPDHESEKKNQQQQEYQNQDLIKQSPSLVTKENIQGYGNHNNSEDSIEQEQYAEESNNSAYYEINRYETGNEQKNEGEFSQSNQNRMALTNQKSQWSFDQEPELPMLEETETPLFEEANPYLVDEGTEMEERTQREILQDKKLHLQIKLKQNIKREDEINQLMQMKVEECKSMAPKNFQEILAFFRSKINMDREYTEEDDREVEAFLAKRNLTDQRKFQNIYKIMHFQMELENTRRIIQSICKKLSELEKDRCA